MIVKKIWYARKGMNDFARCGWYLFGIIPLYIADMQPRNQA
jgi:hypothetical protein